MVVSSVHLNFQIVAYAVDKVYLKERLTTNKVPYHALLLHVSLMVENVVNSLFRHLPRHALLSVLANKIAILAGELAVLGDDESDVLRHTRLPTFVTLPYIKIHNDIS